MPFNRNNVFTNIEELYQESQLFLQDLLQCNLEVDKVALTFINHVRLFIIQLLVENTLETLNLKCELKETTRQLNKERVFIHFYNILCLLRQLYISYNSRVIIRYLCFSETSFWTFVRELYKIQTHFGLLHFAKICWCSAGKFFSNFI